MTVIPEEDAAKWPVHACVQAEAEHDRLACQAADGLFYAGHACASVKMQRY